MVACKSAGIALTCLLVGGCAGVDVQRVKEDDQHGIRYWRPAPYVAVGPVTANGTTTCQASIVWLPDKAEEYAITVNTGLWGTASANPTLEDGWNLTGLNASADSKTAEVLTAVAAVMGAVPKLAVKNVVGASPSKPSCPGGLYRVEYDQYGRIGGVRLISASSGLGFAPPPPPKPSPSPSPAPGGDNGDKKKK